MQNVRMWSEPGAHIVNILLCQEIALKLRVLIELLKEVSASSLNDR